MADDPPVLEPDNGDTSELSQEEYELLKKTAPNGWTPVTSNGKLVGYEDEFGTYISLFGDTQPAQRYFPPDRQVSDASRSSDGRYLFAPPDWTGTGTYTFSGEGIIDREGNILLFDNQGNIRSYMEEDALAEFYSMLDSDREDLLDDLEQIGLNVDSSLRATQSFWVLMQHANQRGLEWRMVLDDLQAQQQRLDLDDAPKYYVSPKATISDTANRVALETLGREFTEQELERFVSSYNEAELATQQQEEGVTQYAPSMSAAAEEFAQQTAPKEADAYAYLNRMNTFIDSLGGL